MEEEEGRWFRGRGERRKHKLRGLVNNNSIHDFLCLLCLGGRSGPWDRGKEWTQMLLEYRMNFKDGKKLKSQGGRVFFFFFNNKVILIYWRWKYNYHPKTIPRMGLDCTEKEKKKNLCLCFFCGPRALFTRSVNTDFSKFFFKTRSHITIHTFKKNFITIFSVFSNKWYPNRHLVNLEIPC